MNVEDFTRGEGPQVSPKFFRGDSFWALDEGHEDCKARSVVLGKGLTFDSQGGMLVVSQGALVRCQGCLLSYVLFDGIASGS